MILSRSAVFNDLTCRLYLPSGECHERQVNSSPGSLTGVAVPTEQWTVLRRVFPQIPQKKLREKFAKGSFTRILNQIAKEEREVRAFIDHDATKLLASTRNQSLQLRETTRGLEFDLELPDTTLGRDAYQLAKNGLLAGMSIGFKPPLTALQRIKHDPNRGVPSPKPSIDSNVDGSTFIEGENDPLDVFHIVTDADLTEISVITGGHPAYKNTSVEARQEQERQAQNNLHLWLAYYENL